MVTNHRFLGNVIPERKPIDYRTIGKPNCEEARLFTRLPLRLILVIPFVLQIVGAVGLVGYLSFKNGEQAVNELAESLMDKSNNLVSERLDNYLATPPKITQINIDAIELGLLNLQDFNRL